MNKFILFGFICIFVLSNLGYSASVSGNGIFIHAMRYDDINDLNQSLIQIKNNLPYITWIEFDIYPQLVNEDNTTSTTYLGNVTERIDLIHNNGFNAAVKMEQYSKPSWYVNGTHGDIYTQLGDGTLVVNVSQYSFARYSLHNPYFKNFFNRSAVVLAGTDVDLIYLGNEIDRNVDDTFGWRDYNSHAIEDYRDKLEELNSTFSYWDDRYSSCGGWTGFDDITPPRKLYSGINNKTHVKDWVIIKNQIVSEYFDSVAKSIKDVNASKPVYISINEMKINQNNDYGSNYLSRSNIFLPMELARQSNIDGIAYNSYPYTTDISGFMYGETAASRWLNGKSIITSESGSLDGSLPLNDLGYKLSLIYNNYFDLNVFFQWDGDDGNRDMLYNDTSSSLTGRGNAIKSMKDNAFEKLNKNNDVYIWFPYSSIGSHNSFFYKFSYWLAKLSKLNIDYAIVDNISNVPSGEDLIIYLPKIQSATAELTEDDNLVFDQSGVTDYLNNTLLAHGSKILVIGGIQAIEYQSIREITSITETTYKWDSGTCANKVIYHSNEYNTVGHECFYTTSDVVSIANYTNNRNAIVSGKDWAENVTSILWIDEASNSELTYYYLKDFGLNPIYNISSDHQIIVRKANSTVYVLEYNGNSGSINISFDGNYDVWEYLDNEIVEVNAETSFIDNIDSEELKVYKIVNISYFNLTYGSSSVLYNEDNEIIDLFIDSEIVSVNDALITFNSTNNYTNTNWKIYIPGDKRYTYTWYYKGHYDSGWTEIPGSNLTYDGTNTLFDLKGINVYKSTGSNEIKGNSSLSIDFINPTDTDNGYISRNNSCVNTSVTDSENSTALIDWNYSLVGWWGLNDGVGTNAEDHSTYGNNGTVTNAVWTSNGKFGHALQFDGNGDFLHIPNSVSLTLPNTFCMSLWFKWDAQVWEDYLVSRNDFNGFRLILEENNKILFKFKHTDGTNQLSYTGISAEKWYHVVFLYDNTLTDGKRQKLYINGVERDTSDYNGTLYSSTNDIYLGKYIAGGAYFNGIIDDVRIYNRALSPEEINASYNVDLYRLYHNFDNLDNGKYDYTVYVQNPNGIVESSSRSVNVNVQSPVYPQAVVLFKSLSQGTNTINIVYKSNLPLIGGGLAGAGAIGYALLRRRRRR